MFDASDLDLDDISEMGAKLYLIDMRTGAKTDGWITVLGPDSSVARKRAYDMRAAPTVATPEQADERVAKWCADVCTGWGGIGWQGAELPFTPENALLMFKRSRSMREQVMAFHDARVNFLGNSRKSSSEQSQS